MVEDNILRAALCDIICVHFKRDYEHFTKDIYCRAFLWLMFLMYSATTHERDKFVKYFDSQDLNSYQPQQYHISEDFVTLSVIVKIKEKSLSLLDTLSFHILVYVL